MEVERCYCDDGGLLHVRVCGHTAAALPVAGCLIGWRETMPYRRYVHGLKPRPRSRVIRLQELAFRYPGDWTPDRDGAPWEELASGRFAILVEDLPNGGRGADFWIGTAETMQVALQVIADWFMDGRAPVGIVDLDTGEPHGVHVATPVITDAGREGAPTVPWHSARPGNGS